MKIAFDEFHKDKKYFSIDDDDQNGYEQLGDFLKGKGIECVQSTNPLTSIPADVDVLVIPFPKRRFDGSEVNEITAFVKDRGKGLLMLSEWGGIFDNVENLNQLAINFEIKFNPDRVCDWENRIQIPFKSKAHAFYIKGFSQHYPFTKDLKELVCISGSSLKPANQGMIAAWAGERSWSDEDGDSSYDEGEAFGYVPIVTANVCGNAQGRVVCCGDASLLANAQFKESEHQKFAHSLFQWLGKEL